MGLDQHNLRFGEKGNYRPKTQNTVPRGESRYVSASDVRRKIQRRACFSARRVVKSSGLGAQPRRHRDGFRTQGGNCRNHMRANSQMKRAGASRYASAGDVRRKIQRRACFSARTVVKSSGLGAQPRRHRDGFRTQGGHCRDRKSVV